MSSNGEPPSAEKPDEPVGPLTPSAVRFWKQVANMTSVGWSTVLPIAGGVLLGYYLDQRTGSDTDFTRHPICSADSGCFS